MPIKRADDTIYTLASSNTSTGPSVAIKGGEYALAFEGTIGGATIVWEMQSPSGTWSSLVDSAGYLVTPLGDTTFRTSIPLPAGNIRISITGGTPSGIYSYLIGLG